MTERTYSPRRWLLLAVVVLLAWLGVGAVASPASGKLSTVQENDQSR